MDTHYRGNQQGLGLRPPLQSQEQAMDVQGNPALGHMGLQHNHVNDGDMGAGSKVMEQYYGMAGHHGGNMYLGGNPQHHPSQGMKGYVANMDGGQYNQMMGSPPGMHVSPGGSMSHNMAMYKSHAMIGHGAGNTPAGGMGMGATGYGRGGGMGQYGNMMQRSMPQHNMAAMQSGHGNMIRMQQPISMNAMGGNGQQGMVGMHGHYGSQQYMDMSQSHRHHQSHPPHHHQQQQQQHPQQPHQQFLGSPNSCIMSPPPQQQSHQQQPLQHTSPTMAQHGYSPSVKAFPANMTMESNAQLQQQSQTQLPQHPLRQQHSQHPQQLQQQEQQQTQPPQQQNRGPQNQYSRHGMSTVNLDQTARALGSTPQQLPDFRTLASASTMGSSDAAATNMPNMGYLRSGMSMTCDKAMDSSGRPGIPGNVRMTQEAGGDLTMGPMHKMQGMPKVMQETFPTPPGAPHQNCKQGYGNQGPVIRANHVNPMVTQQVQNEQMMHHLRTIQSTAVTLNVTSSRVVTQTASAMSPVVTTTHGSPVVSHAALQNPTLTNCLNSGPAVPVITPDQNCTSQPTSHNGSLECSNSLRKSPVAASPAAAVSKQTHPTQSTSISSSKCDTNHSALGAIPACLAKPSGSSLASSAPAISALLSGNRGPTLHKPPPTPNPQTLGPPTSTWRPSGPPPTLPHPHSQHQQQQLQTQSQQLQHQKTHNSNTIVTSSSSKESFLSEGGFEKDKQGVSHVMTTVNSVTVPFGWRRVVEAGAVIYYSASGTRLTSLSHIVKYLQTDGSCKCGLECPILVDKVFNYDPQVASKQWNSIDLSLNDDLSKLCNHKRKIIAMATFRKSALQRDDRMSVVPESGKLGSSHTDKNKMKISEQLSRKGHGNPYEHMLMSQLHSQRDQMNDKDHDPRKTPGQESACSSDAEDMKPLKKQMLEQEQSNAQMSNCVNRVNSTIPRDPHKADGMSLLDIVKQEKVDNFVEQSPNSEKREEIEKKPDLKSMAQKVQAALRKPEWISGCGLKSGRGRGRPRAQSDTGALDLKQEQLMPNHYHPRSFSHSDAYPLHQMNSSLFNSPVMQRTTESVMSQSSQHSTESDYVQAESRMGNKGEHLPIVPLDMINSHRQSGSSHAVNQHLQQEGYHHKAGSTPEYPDANLQIPGLPTMESWAEMQKIGRRKPGASKRGKRRLNHFLDRPPCPNVDVRQMQQEGKPGPTSGGMPSFFDNPTTFLAHQSALMANSLGRTDIPPEINTDHHGGIGSQVSPAPSVSSLSTKSATPTGKITPLSSPGRPCSQNSQTSTGSAPKGYGSGSQQGMGNTFFQSPTGGPNKHSGCGMVHLSPRQIQQMELQKQLHIVTGGSFPNSMAGIDPVTATLMSPKTIKGKAQKNEGRHSPENLNLNLQTVLNPKSSANFPASNLLSAAARAQDEGRHLQASSPESPVKHNDNQSMPLMRNTVPSPQENMHAPPDDRNLRHMPQHQMGRFNNFPANVGMPFMTNPNQSNPMLYQQMAQGGGANGGMNPQAMMMVMSSRERQHQHALPVNTGLGKMYQGPMLRQAQSPRGVPSQFQKEQTPIEKVQDMISGLEAAQNAIVAAHAAANAQESIANKPDGTWPPKRRKSSTSSDTHQSLSRCSDGGASTDTSTNVGMENVPGHQGDMVIGQNMYGNMALTHSVDGTMDPNGPAPGTVVNNNLAQSQGMNRLLSIVNMNMPGMPGGLPSLPLEGMPNVDSNISPVLAMSQLNNPQLMQLVGSAPPIQNPLLMSNPVNLETVQAKMHTPVQKKLNPIEHTVQELFKQGSTETSDRNYGNIRQRPEDSGKDTEPQVMDRSSSEKDLFTRNKNSTDLIREALKADDEKGPSETIERFNVNSGGNETKFQESPSQKEVALENLRVQASHPTSSSSRPLTAGQTSPRGPRTTPELKHKKIRERSRKSTTPTIAKMLQAAQAPQNKNPSMVMLPNMPAQLLQVVNPVLNQMVGQTSEGGMNPQQLMYLQLALQSPQIDPNQNQELLNALGMAQVQDKLNLNQMAFNLGQNQEMGQIQNINDVNLAQNQLNMLQSLNMLPALGAMNPALLQSLQSLPSVGLPGFANFAALQPQLQQQMLKQMTPLLLQNQQLLQQQTLAHKVAQGNKENQEKSLSDQGCEQLRQRESIPVVSPDQVMSTSQLDSSHVSEDNRPRTPLGSLDGGKGVNLKLETGENKDLCSATHTPSASTTSSGSSHSSHSSPFSTKQQANPEAVMDAKPNSPSDSIPNPANLTEAVTAVVRSQDVFGDDDDSPHIKTPVRKYAVRKHRNHIRHISNKLANNPLQNSSSSSVPSLSPTAKSPIARALTFETPPKSPEPVEDPAEQEPLNPTVQEEEHEVSVNSIGTNTYEEGSLENSMEDMEEEADMDRENDEVLMGVNMASTATMTDEEGLTDGDQMPYASSETDAEKKGYDSELDLLSDQEAYDEPGEGEMYEDEPYDVDADMLADAEAEGEADDVRSVTDVSDGNLVEDADVDDSQGTVLTEDYTPLPNKGDTDSVISSTAEDIVLTLNENHIAEDSELNDGTPAVKERPPVMDDRPEDFDTQRETMVDEEDGNNDVEDEYGDLSDDIHNSAPRTFNIGDLVWGQIRGYPSWPGKLVDESSVKGHHQKSEFGKLWVRWFGDHTFTQVEPQELKTLSEGLEAHHDARKKYRRGRKMNTSLESAIQEAMVELDRQTEAASTSNDKLDKAQPAALPPPSPPLTSHVGSPEAPLLTSAAQSSITRASKSRPAKKRKR